MDQEIPQDLNKEEPHRPETVSLPSASDAANQSSDEETQVRPPSGEKLPSVKADPNLVSHLSKLDDLARQSDQKNVSEGTLQSKVDAGFLENSESLKLAGIEEINKTHADDATKPDAPELKAESFKKSIERTPEAENHLSSSNSKEQVETLLANACSRPNKLPILNQGSEDTVLSHSGNEDLKTRLEDHNEKSEPVSESVLQEQNQSPATAMHDVKTSVVETLVSATDASALLAEAATVIPAADSSHESVYYIKWITFNQSNVPIITQNENGPCPLLAILNVLLLQGKVKLAPMLEMITSEQLMTYLGECIFEHMPQNLPETAQANYEQNMQDAMSVMYKLQTGLDVNVRFSGVGDFEFTPELIIFDLLGISLYHGWLVDPQDAVTVEAINQCSYNQLVEKIISLRQSQDEEKVRQALIAEQFLERTAAQLTYHGLCELSSVTGESELCVFFRNNHFNTLYRHNNELFLLVTDQGFLTESNVVWETLSNVDGDCHFTDAAFRTYTKPAPSTVPIPDSSVAVGSPEQIDQDYQVALFLQEEDASIPTNGWSVGLQQGQALADHELALRLQEEENMRLAGEEQRATGSSSPHPPGQSPSSSSEGQRRRVDRTDPHKKDDKSCTVL